jgi:hypothetical protein
VRNRDHGSAGCALAFPRGCGVEMADGDGERIGSIGGLRNLIEIQKARHHLLDLMLLGPAISDHCGLDGERRVFGDLKTCGSGGQHSHTAHLAQLQCRLHINGVENVLESDAVGPVLGDEFLQADGNARQARRHRVARGNLDGAADDAHEPIIVASIGEEIDYAVSGIFRAAVDAEDAHGGSVAGQQSAISIQPSAFRTQHSDFVILTLSGAEEEDLLFGAQQHLGLRDLACSFSLKKISYALAEDCNWPRSRKRW